MNGSSKVLKMDCSHSNSSVEGSASEDQDHVQCQKKLKTTASPSLNSRITDYINTVLSASRDNSAERLNLVMYPSSPVEVQQIDTSVTAGIIAALRLNQWLMATTVCHLNITETFCLPPSVLLNLLYRVLQTHENGELGEMMTILRKHVVLHPPSYSQVLLRDLYTALLIEKCREMLDGEKKTDDGLVIQVLDQLRQIFQSKHVASGSDASEEECDVTQLPLFELVYAMESCQVFKRLSTEDQVFRLSLVLDYAVIVLEQDFLAWHGSRRRWAGLRKTLDYPEQRPLIVALAWPRVKYWRIGTCNAFCRRVTQIVWADKLQGPLLRLLTLLAEVMCISECEGRFPSMGKKCCALAREVSMGMSQSAERFVQQASQLKPDWLALLVVHQAITKVIQPGNVGMPSLDLVEACITLVDRGPIKQPEANQNDEVELELAEPPTKINKRNMIGETRLHRACKKNNVAELKKLLRQPHIDVNVADNAGWTPLHEAVMGGEECVRTLLEYRSRTGMTVDVRAKNQDGITPIMDAAARGKADICKLLLDNSGWCLLEDSRVDGSKAEDLVKAPEVAAILAASRLGKRSLMFNNLTCVNLPQLEMLLPVYFKLYLSTFKVHLVAMKAMRREAPSSDHIKKDSKCFDFSGMYRSLKVLQSIQKSTVHGSQIDRILRGHV